MRQRFEKEILISHEDAVLPEAKQQDFGQFHYFNEESESTFFFPPLIQTLFLALISYRLIA